MIRLFQTHKIREQAEIEGMWDFSPLKEGESLPVEYQYTMPVPGCWEQHPGFLTYRGIGVYRKKIFISSDTAIRMEFKGVSHTADVYIDGIHRAHHYNAYTPFSLTVPYLTTGEHEVVVRVDNSFSEKSALHIGNDYYTYGGIIRPVALEKINEVFIERLEFTPHYSSEGWKAGIKVILNNISNSDKEVSVQGVLAGVILDFGKLLIKAGETINIKKEFVFQGVKSWSSNSPTLYLLELKLYKEDEEMPCDDLIERVGFRVVSIDGQKLLVNNEEVMLKGFNRHEDYGIVGCAIPLQLMVKDLELMKEMGANTLRTCHYPNDERFLDLCDENGIYVWEENHARGLELKHMQNPNFERQCEDCNREMVHNHYNHPSIIIWGILNECASHTEEGRVMYKKQLDQIRGMDQSRPLTSAVCKQYQEKCTDLFDIVSINVYCGWYTNEDPAVFYEKYSAWINENGGEGKPVIISEFGAAAIYGFREPTRARWSEERQCDILDNNLSAYMNSPGVVGTLIWQFCDCRVTEENNWFQTRARTKNNKGIVDEYRRPKLAFETVKEHFRN